MAMENGMMGDGGADKPSGGMMGGGLMDEAHEMMARMSSEQLRQVLEFMREMMGGGEDGGDSVANLLSQFGTV